MKQEYDLVSKEDFVSIFTCLQEARNVDDDLTSFLKRQPVQRFDEAWKIIVGIDRWFSNNEGPFVLDLKRKEDRKRIADYKPSVLRRLVTPVRTMLFWAARNIGIPRSPALKISGSHLVLAWEDVRKRLREELRTKRNNAPIRFAIIRGTLSGPVSETVARGLYATAEAIGAEVTTYRCKFDDYPEIRKNIRAITVANRSAEIPTRAIIVLGADPTQFSDVEETATRAGIAVITFGFKRSSMNIDNSAIGVQLAEFARGEWENRPLTKLGNIAYLAPRPQVKPESLCQSNEGSHTMRIRAFLETLMQQECEKIAESAIPIELKTESLPDRPMTYDVYLKVLDWFRTNPHSANVRVIISPAAELGEGAAQALLELQQKGEVTSDVRIYASDISSRLVDWLRVKNSSVAAACGIDGFYIGACLIRMALHESDRLRQSKKRYTGTILVPPVLIHQINVQSLNIFNAADVPQEFPDLKLLKLYSD